MGLEQEFAEAMNAEVPMDDISMGKLESKCEELFDLKAEITSKKAELAEMNKTLAKKQEVVSRYLEKYKKTSYHSAFGQIVLQERFSVKLPATPVHKAQFFDYLKELGIFENMVTIHSGTLNSFYKDKMNEALEDGKIDFKMPGIGEPKMSKIVAMRGGKK